MVYTSYKIKLLTFSSRWINRFDIVSSLCHISLQATIVVDSKRWTRSVHIFTQIKWKHDLIVSILFIHFHIRHPNALTESVKNERHRRRWIDRWRHVNCLWAEEKNPMRSFFCYRVYVCVSVFFLHNLHFGVGVNCVAIYWFVLPFTVWK